ncbi:mediator of RNA polymerase II transcription subunit 12-like protein isoform X2 [Hydra vulgaris]|uniref:mediator of RNA polymerase II transcription subunit 12-like protein isoform X2 n=1 Tax=Hydra vulgaris TaxID=6087 RepID=UPI001F5E5546|nr:mediator of RNA polymerase II transcription subunit 12-like protein isoform X2 [Hydra vulgaris]
MAINLETFMRPLKRSRLGIPDIYPQDAKQEEDDLCESNVKRGFVNKLAVNGEHGSAKEIAYQVNLSRFAAQFNKILSQKQKINTIQDSRKKVLLNLKDHFWHVTARNKSQVTSWMTDLAANKPLSLLAKKVPIFNKKEEIFLCLAEFGVPMLKATWFIKITYAHQVATAESKMKKRVNIDPYPEWTFAIIKFLHDQLLKLSEQFIQSYMTQKSDIEIASKNWSYIIQLAEWMIEEELLDKHEFFNWMVELIDKFKSNKDDTLLKYILPLILRHLETILKSQILARLLASHCILKLNDLSSSTVLLKCGEESLSKIHPMMSAYKNCNQHSTIITILSGIIQAITLRCPASLIYSIVKEPGKEQVVGSPLDKLIVSPSALFNTDNLDDAEEKKFQEEAVMSLEEKENTILQRSILVEQRWRSSEYNNMRTSDESMLLLDVLDETNFSCSESVGTGEKLYKLLFSEDLNTDDINLQTATDENTILLLCNWSTNKRRFGIHRPLIAATVIKLRNTYIIKKFNSEYNQTCETIYPIHKTLIKFLDEFSRDIDVSQVHFEDSFKSLVFLFCELIRYNVFSHDKFLCSMVSQAILKPEIISKVYGLDISKSKSEHGGDYRNPSLSDHDYDGSTSNFDLDADFMHSILNDNPVFEAAPQLFNLSSTSELSTSKKTTSLSSAEANALYVLHFPIPNGEKHEINQRMVLLLGVGKMLHKEKLKVESIRKQLLDVLNGGNQEKKSELFGDFLTLSHFDQFSISTSISETVKKMKQAFPSKYGIISEFPSSQQLLLLFDLLEMAGNIQELLDFLGFFVARQENTYFSQQDGILLQHCEPSKLLIVIAIIHKYFKCILNSSELTATIFKGLLQRVENIAEPGVCSSTERCTLALLHKMYESCMHLQNRFENVFSTASSKISNAICSIIQPAHPNLVWDTSFLKDYFHLRMTKIDAIWIEYLRNDHHDDLFSFVCNAVTAVCKSHSSTGLYNTSILCCEVTARVSALGPLWLGVAKALCCKPSKEYGFNELLSTINLGSSDVCASLSTFICILVARCCFNINCFLQKVIQPAIMSFNDMSSGLLLTCMILEKLLNSCMGHQLTTSMELFPLEHYLLIGGLTNVLFENMLPIFKCLLTFSQKAIIKNSEFEDVSNDDVFTNLFENGTLDPIPSNELLEASFMQTKDINFTASRIWQTLKILLNQSWIKDHFLKHSNKQTILKALSDQNLEQVQQLISILVNKTSSDCALKTSESFQETASRICMDLDIWSLHVNTLELLLMIKFTSKEELPKFLSAIGQAIMTSLTEDRQKNSVLGSLINKLSVPFQGQILKSAFEIMEKENWWQHSRFNSYCQKTLFTLISSCVKNQESNKNMVLLSILKQLQSLVCALEEEKFDLAPEEYKSLLEGLNFRLNVIGMLFDTILEKSNIILEWTVVLFQLLVSDIVPKQEEAGSMFINITDMVVLLLQSQQLFENAVTQQTPNNDNAKFSSIVRRLRKEITSRPITEVTVYCEELLPLHTAMCEVVTSEPVHSLDVSQGNASTPLNKSDHSDTQLEQGLIITGSQYVNPWELLEDSKQPAPLAFSMFGAVRVEKQTLHYMDEVSQLIHHTHQQTKPLSYYVNINIEEENDIQSQPSTPCTPTVGPLTPLNQSGLSHLLAPIESSDEFIKQMDLKRGFSRTQLHTPNLPEVRNKKLKLLTHHQLGGHQDVQQLFQPMPHKQQHAGLPQELPHNVRIGHNIHGNLSHDNAKTALQNMIARKTSAPATASNQLQQLSRQQQQLDVFGQQQQIASNINISDAIQSNLHSIQSQTALQQQQQISYQQQQQQQMINAQIKLQVQNLQNQYPQTNQQTLRMLLENSYENQHHVVTSESQSRENLLQATIISQNQQLAQQQSIQQQSIQQQSIQQQSIQQQAIQQQSMQQQSIQQQPMQHQSVSQPIQQQPIQQQRSLPQQNLMYRQLFNLQRQQAESGFQTGVQRQQVDNGYLSGIQRPQAENSFQAGTQRQQIADVTLYQRQLSTPVSDYQTQVLMQYQQGQAQPGHNLSMQPNQRP